MGIKGPLYSLSSELTGSLCTCPKELGVRGNTESPFSTAPWPHHPLLLGFHPERCACHGANNHQHPPSFPWLAKHLISYVMHCISVGEPMAHVLLCFSFKIKYGNAEFWFLFLLKLQHSGLITVLTLCDK